MNKKEKGFTYIEIIVSIVLFLLTIIPAIEFNRIILKTDRKYCSIESGIKNIEVLEKKIRSRGYKRLSNYLGEYEYEFLEDSYLIKGNGIFQDLELPFIAKKGEKIIVKIEKLKMMSSVEEKDILSLKIEFKTKYKNLKLERLIVDLEEYYD